MSTRIGILHPGQMGASVAAAAAARGARVGWASEGRSAASRRRASEAELEDLGSVRALAEWSEVILSVCPPAAATAVAMEVAQAGFGGVFVDANAVAPATARGIARIVEDGGARFVDGGIVGLPPEREGTTRLYLSGADAAEVAAVFDGSLIGAAVVEGGPGAASALKACYAAWTKGSAALLVAIRALADAEGVEAPLLAEWGLSQPGLGERSDGAARKNAFKAWRFEGEMLEIADAFEAAGLPRGFHEAAAEVYGRLAPFKDREPPPQVGEAIAKVRSASR